jgi:hypothetical protein
MVFVYLYLGEFTFTSVQLATKRNITHNVTLPRRTEPRSYRSLGDKPTSTISSEHVKSTRP